MALFWEVDAVFLDVVVVVFEFFVPFDVLESVLLSVELSVPSSSSVVSVESSSSSSVVSVSSSVVLVVS